MKTKIAINALSLLSLPAGIGNFLYNVSRSLLEKDCKNEYFFYYGFFSRSLRTPPGTHSLDKSGRFRSILNSRPRLKGVLRNALWEYHKLASSAKRFDIYFEPNFIPIGIRSRRVITAVHDFSFLRFPEWHPAERIGYFKKHFFTEVKRSDVVITVSQFVKNEALKYLGMREDRIRVVHNGFDDELFRPQDRDKIEAYSRKKGLPADFFLFIGSLEPRKNFEGLLHAFETLPPELQKTYKLVLAGANGWSNCDLIREINRLRGKLVLLGHVDRMELPLLYGAAKALVYPSFYEGFGLPPLEAMACGCPVIVSEAASMPEICKDAVYYVNPFSVESICRGMYNILADDDLRTDLIKRGLERSKCFSWKKTARELAAIFAEVY